MVAIQRSGGRGGLRFNLILCVKKFQKSAHSQSPVREPPASGSERDLV